jgi:TonB family protein
LQRGIADRDSVENPRNSVMPLKTAVFLPVLLVACATPAPSAKNPPSYWDDPQPQCFLGDAIAAGSRMGTEGMPANAGETGNLGGQAKGGMRRQEVENVIQGHLEEIRYCYGQGLAADPQLKGNIVVRFTVGGGGKVLASSVATSTIADDFVQSCVARAVCRWVFEAPPGNNNVVVTYPFELQSRVTPE